MTRGLRRPTSGPQEVYLVKKIMLGIIFGHWQCQMVFDNGYAEVLQSADNAIVPACSGIY